jgi:formate hydrogenlyase transcriptional activator
MGKSESTQASKQPFDEQDQLQLVISALNTGLALIDPDMTLVWANDVIKKLFPKANIYGKKCFDVAENRNTPCEDCQTVLAFKDGKIHEREFQNEQNKRWYKVAAFPVRDQEGRLIYVLEASSDIDDRKQVEKKRDQALKELKALKKKLEEENISLRQEISSSHSFTKIIGESNAMLYVLSKVKQVAPIDTTVLVLGETGVGKELIAAAIHRNSGRAKKPFIRVNCAALSPTLIESEFFGHEPGAFTDARSLRRGRFELADGGTILLDEICEIPPETQAKLLRVIQEGQFERLGGTKTLSVDVRIIAATNRDMQEEIGAGRFRTDLYYRLSVFPVTVPPLRSRREDIPLLVRHYVPLIAAKTGKVVDEIPSAVMERLCAYEWPGNVRELRNILEQAVITSRDNVLRLPEGFGDGSGKGGPAQPDQWTSLEEVERKYIEAVLSKSRGHIEGSDGAAVILGLNPSTLRSRLQKLGINLKQFR